eukprot:2430737-Amphidinium_carterae.1
MALVMFTDESGTKTDAPDPTEGVMKQKTNFRKSEVRESGVYGTPRKILYVYDVFFFKLSSEQ